MMKKKILPLPLLALTLVSCNKNNNGIVYIPFGKLYDSTLASDVNSLYLHTTNISYEDLNRKIKNEDNFVLLVYEYKTLEKGEEIECICYTSFAYNLNIYIKSNNIEIYGIDPSDFKGTGKTFSLDLVSGEQTLAIFKDGEVYKQETTANESLSNQEKIERFFNNVSFSNMLYVNKNQLDSMFEEKETFTIGYLRKTCSDCEYLIRDFLKEYNKKPLNKTIYVLDCDINGIRYENGQFNSTLWQEFKDSYGLSNKYNANFGYDVGYIPTFLTYKIEGKKDYFAEYVIDGAVAYNDILTKIEDKVIISNSYWNGAKHSFFSSLDSSIKTKLTNKEISIDEYDDYGEDGIYWKKEYAREYHNPLIKGFLDYYSN